MENTRLYKEFKFVHKDSLLSPVETKRIEELRKAVYIGEFSLKTKQGSWSDFPVAVFYTPEKHPEGSNYFGLYFNCGKVFITNAIAAAEEDWSGIFDPVTNEVTYSGYRHDFQSLPNGSFIDGGKEYVRTNTQNLCKVRILKDKLSLDF